MSHGRSRRILWLLAGALAFRLALAVPAWTHPERLLAEEDSAEYVQLARNLGGGHGFSQAAQPPYEPDVRRTPVYPAVLAAVFAVPGTGARSAAIAGALLSVLTVLATYRFTAPLYGAGAARWAAVLLTFDLTSAIYATQLLTEPLFTLLLVLSFVPLLDRSLGTSAAAGAVAGALSGVAALCRPIGVLAFASLAPACGMARRGVRQAAIALLTASLVAVALVAGWTLRNYRASGTATVSSVAATNMYFHRAAYVAAWLEHRRVEDLRDAWERDFRARAVSWTEPERVAWMNAHGRGLVLRHPFVYALVATGGALRMLTPDHIVLATLSGGDDTAMFRVLHSAAWLQLALVYALACAALVRTRRMTARRLAVPLAPIVYFLLIGGPEMYPRFRVPLMPFVCAIAGGGLAGAQPVRES